MSKPPITLVIGDFHMGAGPVLPDGSSNYLEDFFHDKRLVEFLDYYSTGQNAKREIELVINGDFINHLQVYPDEKNPEEMTESVALRRTKAVVSGHPEVFKALARFAKAAHHSIIFIIGNHDIGLFWPEVSDYLEEVIGSSMRVHRAAAYLRGSLWIEHGNQQVAENRVDFDHPISKRKDGKRVIKLPWGDIFVLRFLNKVKKKRPYIDKVFPFGLYLRWALIHDTCFALRASMAGIVYFFQVLFSFRGRRGLGRLQFLKIMKEFSIPVKMDRAARRIFALHPEMGVVVFGHGHRAVSRTFAGGKQYFNSGIWNEMISLDLGTIGRTLKLTFVEIERDADGRPRGRLLEWKGRHNDVEEV